MLSNTRLERCRIARRFELVVSDLPRPNGIAFSPGEKYLYVDNTEPKKLWMRYTVHLDGTLGRCEGAV